MLAEIQALLPNGTYRAIIAQRDVTLALPFSAKPGDSLELEVTESHGQLTLTLAANQKPGTSEKPPTESVSTTLSQTGRLIGQLFSTDEGNTGKMPPLPLNGNQPLVPAFHGEAAQLAPALKEAIANSGMFYEAHQVQWVEGKKSFTELLREPQGQHFRQPESLAAQLHNETSPTSSPSLPPAIGNQATKLAVNVEPQVTQHTITADVRPQNVESFQSFASPTSRETGTTFIPAELVPIVRQQLDALATQNYVWQGQVWPGQTMDWEITQDKTEEDAHHSDEAGRPTIWRTRLFLALPLLGNVEARVGLSREGVELFISADNENGRHQLIASGSDLRDQLEAAGLALTGFSVSAGQNDCGSKT